MPHLRAVRRLALLAVSLLSACAASDPTPTAARTAGRNYQSGAYGSFLAGRFALATADADTAASDLLTALASNPKDPELIQQAFAACLMAGRPEAETLARSLPDNQVAHLVLANADAKAGRWKQAEQRFKALPRQGPVQILQPVLVAWAQQGDGRTDDALATLRPLIEMQRLRGLFGLHAALISDLAGRKQDASRFYLIARSEAGDPNIRIAELVASWYARNGQPQDAEKLLIDMTEQSLDASIALPALLAAAPRRVISRPTDGLAEAYLAFGGVLRAQNAAAASLMFLRLALDLRPDLSAARILSAEVEQIQQHPQVALRQLAAVPNNDVLSGLARLRRAMLLERTGKTDDAIRALRQIGEDYPRSPLPDFHLGDVYRVNSRFKDAIASYDRAIARVPRPMPADWVMFYHRGIAYDRDMQWEKAENDFEQALKLAPNQPLVLNYLGYSWADRGHNLERAKEMIERAVQRRPNDGAITDSLGWVLFRMGRTNEAVKVLERAVELEPDDATVNAHLGDVYWAVGRRIEAQYQWRRALTLNPPAEDVAKLEAKLRSESPDPVVGRQ